MYTIVERNIGRAGTRQQALQKQKEWNNKYGENKWLTGYELNDKFLTREEAIKELYFKSYFLLLDNNSQLVNKISSYGGVFNPHAYFTNSVDIQAEAVIRYFEFRQLKFSGPSNQLLAAGVWQPRNNKEKIFSEARSFGIKNNSEKLLYPNESYQLSPFKVMCWHDSSLSVEEFWQSHAKCLAVKN